MKDTDPGRFVFVDECGTNITPTRLYARAPTGERAFGKVPRNLNLYMEAAPPRRLKINIPAIAKASVTSNAPLR